MSLIYPKNVKAVDKLLQSFMPFAKERLGYDNSPDIRLARDPENAKDPLGKTAYYEPQHSRITVYVDGRHVKDIMRSIAHEMVHHAQNVRGDLQHVSAAGEQGYAQNDEHLREMEREAYEQGNLCFRDWEDGIKMNGGNLYESEDRGDLIQMIRDYSKELTGRRETYGDIEKLDRMTDEQLKDYYDGMFDSPEAQDMQQAIKDKEDEELGFDTEYDMMPTQSGFGRGLREGTSMFDNRRAKLNLKLMESFGYKLTESSTSPAQGDDVRIIGGTLTGAEGEVIELTTTGGIGIEGGLPAIVVRLTKAADKRIYGGPGDEVIVQPKFVEVDRGIQDYDDSDNPEDDYNWVGHRAHYQEGYKWDSTSELGKAMSGMDKETFKQTLKDVQKQLGLSDEEFNQRIIKFVNGEGDNQMKKEEHMTEDEGGMPRMESGPGGIEIFIPGLGTMSEQGGAPIYLEKNGNSWELLVWSDISSEDPTHRIDLAMAAESGNLQEGEARHRIPDFFGSDEEKEMMKKMSNKEFYKYVTRDRHIVPNLKGDMDEIPGMEGPFQFRSGAVLYYDPKAGKYYDRGKDMYLDNDEAAEVTMENLQDVIKARLSEVFEKYPQILNNEYFINSLKEGVKNKLMEKNKMKLKKNKSLGDLVTEQVHSKLQEGFGSFDDEFGFDDEYGEPSEEDEMIAQLLKKYKLDGDAAPTDADAEAAAERDSMGEFDAEAEDDEEPTVMKEESGGFMELMNKYPECEVTRDNDGTLMAYCDGETLARMKRQDGVAMSDMGLAIDRNQDGSFSIYSEEHADESGMYESKGTDEDGDGDVDSDDYMAKKDKAIKKAMGKEEDDDESVEEDTGAAHSQLRHSRLNETLMSWATK